MKKVLKVLGVIVVLIVIGGIVSCTSSLGKKDNTSTKIETTTQPTKEDYKTLRSAVEGLMAGKDRVTKISKDDYELYTRLKKYDDSIVKKKEAVNFISDVKEKEIYKDKLGGTHEALQSLCKMLKEPSTYSAVKAKEAVMTIHGNANWAEAEYNKIKDK
jgi:preprotein translocase subunit SecF